MTEDRIKNLLKETDRLAGRPKTFKVDISSIRKKAQRRKIINIASPVAAAAVLIFGVGFLILHAPDTESIEKPVETASTEMKIKQLQASTDATLNLIHEILEQEQRQQRLKVLKAELAAIPDPIKQINEELDRTAFILVYSADKMYNELNLTDSAVETYKRVIKLFPDNQWAQVARERLDTIKNAENKNRSKGDSKWKKQNILS
jgi:hypothetical protein